MIILTFQLQNVKNLNLSVNVLLPSVSVLKLSVLVMVKLQNLLITLLVVLLLS